MAGYRNVLCHNAFIYHYDHVSMKKDPEAYNKSLWENKIKLTEKLGFDFEQYNAYNRELAGMVEEPEKGKLSVLVIGCGFGLMLSLLKYKFPEAMLIGIEDNEVVAKIGKQIANVICTNVEKEPLLLEENTFDYILIPDRINQYENPKRVLTNIKKYMKEDGKLIVLTKNLLHGGAFAKILKGNFETIWEKNPGLRHFYTKDEVVNLLTDAGLVPRFLLKMVVNSTCESEEDAKCLEAIKALPGVTVGGEFNVVSYIITATLK